MGKKNGVYLKCEYCGREIYRTQYQFNKHKHHFCSNKCQKDYQHKEAFENRVCEICGSVFTVSKKSKQRFCQAKCQNIWQTKQIGVLNPRFASKKISCDYCGADHFVPEHKLLLSKNHFCSKDCRKKWYSEVWSQSDEWREESRLRATNLLQNNTPTVNTKPQQIVNQILDSMSVKYINEYNCKYYSIDNYLPDQNLMIEVMGDFWHANPKKYNRSSLRDIQKKRIPKDKAKHTYISNQYHIEILYLWEDDLYNHPELCERLISHYIKSNGILSDYHSFNYYIDKDELCRSETTLHPYFETIDNVNA